MNKMFLILLTVIMRRYFFTIFILLVVSLLPFTGNADERVNHDLTVSLYPAEHRFLAEDRIVVPEKLLTDCHFLLHKGLSPMSLTPGVSFIREGSEKAFVGSYRVILPPGVKTFTIKYGGQIHHPIEPYGKEYARGFRQTPGTISDEGVYLSGSSYWYPVFDQAWLSFTLQVTLSEDWDAVSQGERTRHIRENGLTMDRWESPEPQDEIYLIAARFAEYERSAGPMKDMVFLRSPDEKLADKYLDATARYITMYDKLIGPYPYKKFALVENFWETGLGMPSFTLLGQKIIRFPFIIDSSYPHEILHNWWGNSVFPDYEKGNWSEGLTAYLSDYLIQEQRHNAVEYRQTTLQKYTDYASGGKDFPLIKFTTRHDSSTEAVGYGKCLMFFHMLRRLLGDELFISGLQDFYRENKFRTASFDDLRRSFEQVSQEDLEVEFNQWTKRTGAPILRVTNAVTRGLVGNYSLTAHLEQNQPGDAYTIRVPVVATLEGRKDAYRDIVVMNEKQQDFEIRLPARPLRLDIDPQFDIFRKLDRREVPPALTEAFGARKVLIILPSAASVSLQEGYRELGRSWMQSGPDRVKMRFDNEVETLPTDRAVVIFGWENRFLDKFATAVSNYDVAIGQNGVRIRGTEIPKKDHAIVLTARHPEDIELPFTWVATDRVEAIPGLGRKLPHYHKYSYLGFQGAEPTNMAKGRWPVLDSPMTILMPDEQGKVSRVQMGGLPYREPLAVLPPVFSR